MACERRKENEERMRVEKKKKAKRPIDFAKISKLNILSLLRRCKCNFRKMLSLDRVSATRKKIDTNIFIKNKLRLSELLNSYCFYIPIFM